MATESLIDYWGHPKPKNTKQPSKAARGRVRAAFDGTSLIDICERDASDFGDYATRVDLAPDRPDHDRFYFYKDNGSDILAVAHLDTVQSDRGTQVTDTASGLLVTSGALDDRLGAYVILEMLPRLGIVCDWLLTTDEEMGATTAEDFATDKAYNWIIEFDRGGTDVVLYQYETDDLSDLVEDSGARVGVGSYSDICALEHLGVAAFNWGVGYADYHSTRSHAWLDDTFRSVARFVKFHKANAETRLPHCVSSLKSWEDTYLVAECGDLVDVDDDTTYLVLEGGYIVCMDCGTDKAAAEGGWEHI